MSESVTHYIRIFVGFAVFFLVTFVGWELAKKSVWFAGVWESLLNRLFIVIVGTILVIGLFSFIYSYFWGRRNFIRAFKEVGIFKLDKCKENELVRIQGELVLIGSPLIAPFSGKECAAFETRASTMETVVTVTTIGSHVESKQIWVTLKTASDTSDFLIKCKDSYALVRVQECKLKIHEDIIHDENSYDKDRGGFLSEHENTIRENALTRMNHSSRNFIGTYAQNIKFEEGLLEQGEQVAVRGVGKWVNVADLEELSFLLSKGVDKIFEIRNSADYQLYISDSLDVLEEAVGTKI
ncbi:hypothetical protein CWE13_02915 [Aliidiomarina shirensis]|uniref:Uncharacterized protein n=1 Tax=Aliidiomarina shirensis TaxID=1048642 RepID=A0A432WXW1_9GAMM|nr:hypothetical protein [Aliidiomarina shirensis]RUO38612.1 hypothetical protein CWE13_02915 [Aliidiomarina shirensis]